MVNHWQFVPKGCNLSVLLTRFLSPVMYMIPLSLLTHAEVAQRTSVSINSDRFLREHPAEPFKWQHTCAGQFLRMEGFELMPSEIARYLVGGICRQPILWMANMGILIFRLWIRASELDLFWISKMLACWVFAWLNIILRGPCGEFRASSMISVAMLLGCGIRKYLSAMAHQWKFYFEALRRIHFSISREWRVLLFLLQYAIMIWLCLDWIIEISKVSKH